MKIDNNLDRKRWFVLVISCFINLCIGSIYAWSVFAGPMEEHLREAYGIEIATGGLAIVFTVANMVGPITMIPGGRINDLLGPKWVVFTGGILYGGGMIASSFASSVGMLIISYGLGCGLGLGMVYGCNINNTVKYFPDKRGLIGGLATASYGISSVLVPPIANMINSSVGIVWSFRAFGIVFMAVICLGAFFLKKCPDDYVPSSMPSKTGDLNASSAAQANFSWQEMLKTPSFYLMITMLTCGAISGLMCISQASAMSIELTGATTSAAAIIVSVLALFNAGGRIASGTISDRIGRTVTLLGAFALSAAGMILLFTAGNFIAAFCVGICFIGISFGTFMGVYPAFTADRFGTANNSVNYGIMFIGFSAAGYIGPTIMSGLHAATGSYSLAFLAALVFTAAGAAICLIYRKVNK